MIGSKTAAACSLLLAAAVRLPSSDPPSLALSGSLAAPLAALAAGRIAGARAAAWAGVLVALSPIHTLASRGPAAGPEAVLVPSLLLALLLVAALEHDGSRGLAIGRAVGLGVLLGGLGAAGVASFAAAALLLPAWLALRPERRGAALLSTAVALGFVAVAAALGLARSPFDYGEIAPSMPATTLAGLFRCTGASLTRVIGIEYQLVVAHARYVLPLTALFLALALRGAHKLPARTQALLLAGALVPFVLGATLAVVDGRVLPLQAARLVGAQPFVALLMAAGLASLRGTLAWAAGTTVAASLAGFLALALAR